MLIVMNSKLTKMIGKDKENHISKIVNPMKKVYHMYILYIYMYILYTYIYICVCIYYILFFDSLLSSMAPWGGPMLGTN